MKNTAVHRALKQQECKFRAMMSELYVLADTLEGDDLLNAITEVETKYS